MKRRLVLLLSDPVQLTPRLLAQKRYASSTKGKAAHARYKAKKRQDAAWRAAEVARARRWRAANMDQRRAWKRIYQRMRAAA